MVILLKGQRLRTRCKSLLPRRGAVSAGDGFRPLHDWVPCAADPEGGSRR